MPYPFEATPEEIEADPDSFVDSVFSSLESEFLVLPRGDGFIDYPTFEGAYQTLKGLTAGFEDLRVESILPAVERAPLVLIVLRAMLGLTPPEWAYIATQRGDVEIPQGFARTLDRNVRMARGRTIPFTAAVAERVEVLVRTACELLNSAVPEVEEGQLHRLDKADTREGVTSIRAAATLGVPYAMLLYERFLGRPFAGHRDSVSELVGDSLESAVEDVLAKARITYRKTKRAERIRGFDQAPDFIVPDEFNPQVIIEAKITEDDGTARDKVTRIQHLSALSTGARRRGAPKFEVVACIAGRGFGVRREDMKKLLLATRGKVFTLKTLDSLVGNTRLREFLPRTK